MTFSTTAHADSQAKRNVAVLVAAQSVLGSQMPMIFIVGGLAGESLATNACLATLPISLIVLGSMLAATPMSAIMQKWGRRAGFLVGASAGAVGGVVGAYGLYLGSFPVFLLGSLLTGIYMSAHGFYRFAAADTASDAFRPKAISYVMAGGLAAAIIGPQIVKLTSTAYIIPFLGTYIAIIALNVIGSVLFFFLDIPTPSKPTEDSPKGRTRLEMLKSPRIAV
ncbi:MAG: MFS transporter, partial [Pseudomonadota bacterium]